MLLQLRLYLKLLLMLVMILFFIAGCAKTSSEQQIRDQINNLQQAISDKSLSTFMAYFTKDFSGNKSLSRGDLQRLIFFQFKSNHLVDSFQWQADIKIKNEIAFVEIITIVTGTNNSNGLPERGRIFTINASWKKIDNNWLIFEANWKDTLLD